MTPVPMEKKLDLDAIKERAAAARPGPWRWNLNMKSRHLTLEAMVDDLEIVLDFVRWGMAGATARFQNRGVMYNASAYGKTVDGREHHAGWFQTLHHPDAVFIANARKDVDDLVAEVERLQAQQQKAVEEAVENEQTRWQQRFDYLAGKYGVDGAGCESGDPLDFTEAEVKQSLNRVEEERDRAQDLLKQAHDALMISPLGYHPRGAAHRVFAMLMDNLEIINAAWERQMVKAATPAP